MKPDEHPLQIAAISDQPHFLRAVADRVWNAWWREEGFSLGQIEERVRESMGQDALPATLVASSAGAFLGTVSIVKNDMAERPALSPWLAALWVDPQHRRRGVGAALVEAATSTAFTAGVDTLHLCTTPDNAPFYGKLGWQQVEANVAGLSILSRSR
ncbi:GNAT family N-acetyltransferase [Chondromyces crocatus]|uniref:Acetyltransferase n=1 Tax=Chondromyces crocatus TaxID=52 RepID=A0A0K1EK44_CHOCO|nr:GNAT family N-acetyltransferase [Chondromyces crocatus]AKT41235.1 acetyltransferase [Chondromyces crocatus]